MIALYCIHAIIHKCTVLVYSKVIFCRHVQQARKCQMTFCVNEIYQHLDGIRKQDLITLVIWSHGFLTLLLFCWMNHVSNKQTDSSCMHEKNNDIFVLHFNTERKFLKFKLNVDVSVCRSLLLHHLSVSPSLYLLYPFSFLPPLKIPLSACLRKNTASFCDSKRKDWRRKQRRIWRQPKAKRNEK